MKNFFVYVCLFVYELRYNFYEQLILRKIFNSHPVYYTVIYPLRNLNKGYTINVMLLSRKDNSFLSTDITLI